MATGTHLPREPRREEPEHGIFQLRIADGNSFKETSTACLITRWSASGQQTTRTARRQPRDFRTSS
ncbi:hypothetical protein EV363DRAFT_1405444 [Boletus edulis]|uniref:Uncharacterized protein n=1 Tax=Boletus edulis BED1 TaxID=1328754 RepID=A0AAD4BUA9_BOLED|nr:hypothetical protein EV363DRAFT_1405444 [Boletus edulis]KAF8440352.1 hypothetical protein L210DRAFT_943822 [Boletus edulis BED1]